MNPHAAVYCTCNSNSCTCHDRECKWYTNTDYVTLCSISCLLMLLSVSNDLQLAPLSICVAMDRLSLHFICAPH